LVVRNVGQFDGFASLKLSLNPEISARTPKQDGLTPLQWAVDNVQTDLVVALLGKKADKEAKYEVRGAWGEERIANQAPQGSFHSWLVLLSCRYLDFLILQCQWKEPRSQVRFAHYRASDEQQNANARCLACTTFTTFNPSPSTLQDGHTLLHRAVNGGHASVAEKLLAAGADTEAKHEVRGGRGTWGDWDMEGFEVLLKIDFWATH
jgi:hypothetical protein